MLAELLSRAPLLTDGALGTEFQARGLASGDLPDEWNLSRPQVVEEVIRSYVEAGSDIVLTATFRANRIVLAASGLADKLEAINRAGVAAAKRAAGDRARVFASVGPSGKLLMTGDVTDDELRAAFTEQSRILASAGADGIIFETMTDLDEAAIAVESARGLGVPVGCSMVFDSGRNKDRTMMGATPEQVAERLEAAGADIIGANCGTGIEPYINVCRRMRAATSRPLWIKPNAGLPQMEDGKAVYKTTPEEFAGRVPALVEAGASFIGGCCGTNPAFIRAARAALAGIASRTQ
jgi:5-methyltetrahydrofolate--homocysteine methyltransferase